MSPRRPPIGRTKRARITRVLQAGLLLAGVGLLVALLIRTDTARLWARVSRTGPYFCAALAAYGLRVLGSAAAWRSIIAPGQPMDLGPLFAAQWCGEALNFVLPGGAPGEIAKGIVLREHLPAKELAISLTLYNWLTGITIFVTVLFGASYALWAMPLPPTVPAMALGAAIALGLIMLMLRLAMRRANLRWWLGLAQKLPLVDFDVEDMTSRASELDRRLVRLWTHDRLRLVQALMHLSLVRLFSILEVYLLLLGLMPQEEPLGLISLALLIQAVTEVMLYLVLVVPGQVGAMEGGMAGVFAMLGLGSWLGLSLELLRRARKLVAIGIGLGLFLFLRHSSGERTRTT